MKGYSRFLLTVIFVAAFAESVYAEDTLTAADKRRFIRDLSRIQRDIQDGKQTLAIESLSQMLSSLKDIQTQTVATFFPSSFESFNVTDRHLSFFEKDAAKDSYGILFARHYQNDEGHSIDLNVVFSDDSIEEYRSVIHNKRLSRKLDHTEVITLEGGYKALEKYSEKERFCERNILVSDDLMVNIITSGSPTKNLMINFTNAINFTALSTLLSK